jgi:hypothetical protein
VRNIGSIAPIQHICKKKRRDHLIGLAEQSPEWAVGFLDEVWWSRIAQPPRQQWQEGTAPPHAYQLHLPQDEQNAIACQGVLLERDVATAPQMLLHFVAGRPVSVVTMEFLAWAGAQWQVQGIGVWVPGWDNAPWHRSTAVRTWIRQHNQQVKATGQGVRILPCSVPSQSPWLNQIEAQWVHGKRAVAELDRPLDLDEIEARVCAGYRGAMTDHLIHPSLRKTEEAA